MKTKKGKFKTTMINLKYSNKKSSNNLSSIINQAKENKKMKMIKSNNNLKISSNSIKNIEITKKIMNRRRLNSCKLENKMNLKMNQNSNEQSSNIKDNSNNNISLMKVFSSRNNLKKNSYNISIDSFKNRSIIKKLK